MLLDMEITFENFTCSFQMSEREFASQNEKTRGRCLWYQHDTEYPMGNCKSFPSLFFQRNRIGLVYPPTRFFVIVTDFKGEKQAGVLPLNLPLSTSAPEQMELNFLTSAARSVGPRFQAKGFICLLQSVVCPASFHARCREKTAVLILIPLCSAVSPGRAGTCPICRARSAWKNSRHRGMGDGRPAARARDEADGLMLGGSTSEFSVLP